MPMPTYELDLRIDARAEHADALASTLTDESQRVRSRLYQKLGLRPHSAGWVTIDPLSSKGQHALQRLIEASRGGEAVAGAGKLWEHLDPGQAATIEWFCLTTDTAPESFSLWDEYPSYKAGTHPKGHALNHTFVSAAFVEACQAAGLTGISFLCCRNAGRKAGPPWYAALPDGSLGHGLDHPWLDRDKWLRDVGDDRAKRSTSLDTGQSNFHQRWLRDVLGPDARFLRPLLDLFAQTAHASTLTGLTVHTVPRYWSKAAPPGDFAYAPWGEDGPNREGKLMRFRLLMVRRRARDALIETGLFAEKAFAPVLSIDTPEPGVARLDALHDRVPPMYSAAELSAMRVEERKLLAAAKAAPPTA
jgi:hypothetical protein